MASRRIVLAATALAVLGVGYVAWRLHGIDIDTPVTLTRAASGDLPDLRNGHVVHLTADGDVLLHGAPHTLDALAEAVAGDTRPVLLCADRDASGLDFLYLCGVLAEHDVLAGQGVPRPLWIAVDDCWRRAALPLRVGWPKWPWLTVRVDAPEASDPREALPDRLAAFHVPKAAAENAVVTKEDLTDDLLGIDAPLAGTLADLFDAMREYARKHKEPWDGAHGQLIHATYVPFRWVVHAIDAFRRAGADTVAVGFLQPHPWVRRQPRLERPAWCIAFGLPPVLWHVPVSLPAALGTDRKPADYLLLALTAEGRLFCRVRPCTLDSLGTALKSFADACGLKARRKGLESRENGWSRGHVLLRADKEAAWAHVLWTLGVVRECGIRHVAFAAYPTAYRDTPPEEAKALGVERTDWVPPPADIKESALPLVLADARGGPGAALRVVVERDGTVRREGEDGEPDAVVLQAAPDVPLKYVVAELGRLDRALPVHFAGIQDVPHAVREETPLPAPGR